MTIVSLESLNRGRPQPRGSSAPEAPVAPPRVEFDEETLRRLVPPYRVVLHNDDHNSMDHVIRALVLSVPSLAFERAVEIMFEAHNHGEATVIVCSREEAELYRERIESFGLTATIEPD